MVPVGVADRRDRQRDVDQRAVLAPAHRVEVLDPLAAANAAEDHVLFGKAIRRNQHRDRLPDGLGGGVSEQLLRRRDSRT